MVRGAHQHGLLLEGDAFLPVRQYLLADRQDLSIFVGTSDEAGPHSGLSGHGVKHGGEPFWGLFSHTICHVQDLLARSVVGVENYSPRPWKDSLEVQDVARFGGAERVDRLCIVSDDRDSFVGSAKRLQNIYLQSVHVLVFIHQYVIERTGKA